VRKSAHRRQSAHAGKAVHLGKPLGAGPHPPNFDPLFPQTYGVYICFLEVSSDCSFKTSQANLHRSPRVQSSLTQSGDQSHANSRVGFSGCGRFDRGHPLHHNVRGWASGWWLFERRWTLNRAVCLPGSTSRTSSAPFAFTRQSSGSPAGPAPAYRLQEKSSFSPTHTRQVHTHGSKPTEARRARQDGRCHWGRSESRSGCRHRHPSGAPGQQGCSWYRTDEGQGRSGQELASQTLDREATAR
jgi:hypothetical protein